jgi:uncharacterized RDD family membrane protein YckC
MRDDTGEPQAGPRYESAPELKLEARVRVRSSMGWRRPTARIIDLALLAAPVVWVFSILPGPPPPDIPDDWGLGLKILAVIGSILWVVVGWPIYEALSVAVFGRTFGKWITGLCVVDEDEGRIRVGSLLGRTLLVVGSFVVTLLIALRLWFVYPPLAVIPLAALGLSQAIPALRGQRTWLDLASGSDVIRKGRLLGPG